jgi:dienelactone hydrolase
MVVDMYGKGIVTEDPEEAGQLAGKFYGSPLMATRVRAGLDQLLAVKGVDAARVAAIGYCFGGSTVQALAFTGAPLAGIVSFHGGLVGPIQADAAKVKGSVLMLNGAADSFVAAEDILSFKVALEAAGTDYVWVDFAGAKHAFTNPGADAVAARTGLDVAYDQQADHRSWRYMQDFFDEIFGRR